MARKGRFNPPNINCLLILLFIVFPVLFLAVSVKAESHAVVKSKPVPEPQVNDYHGHRTDPYDIGTSVDELLVGPFKYGDPSPVIGIDLGDVHTRIGYIKYDDMRRWPCGKMPGSMRFLADSDGHRSISSFNMCADEDTTEHAIPCFSRPASETDFELKEIFRRNPETIREVLDSARGRIAQVSGIPESEVTLPIPDEALTHGLKNASTHVLQRMKSIAEEHFGHPVRYAVLTVPTYYNDLQKEVIRNGGKDAGLDILRFLKRPVAAGIAYGLDKDINYENDEQMVVVVDVNKGETDVTVVDIDSGVFEILGTAHESGNNFTDQQIYAIVAGSIANEWENQHNISLRENSRFMLDVQNQVERAKEINPTNGTVEIDVYPGFRAAMTRAELERRTQPPLAGSLILVDDALKEARLKLSQVDQVVLIGDSTRNPELHSVLEQYFGKAPIQNDGIKPEEAVVIGAAIQGGVLSGEYDCGCSAWWQYAQTDLKLGVEVAGGHRMDFIWPQDNIPTRQAMNFTTLHDWQSRVDIKIKESTYDKSDHLLWILSLEVPPALRGTPTIEVTLEVDGYENIHAKAVHVESGKVETFSQFRDGGLATSHGSQPDSNGGEIVLANVMGISAGHSEL
ncbi:actin-like ATPase domain-containing protein [Lentithecium fluviatile CBS 122367]|uniref:Actin-like ATPase domain-containing protein n=1 Tax=Lentithecium fluviatile CBS 122367 TaxID=1168545 RepID=A0A6G1JH66_9PLEO|nr:actin-like ATPase domain-containing protein [Lentithecium fluviatile CBS 122367]